MGDLTETQQLLLNTIKDYIQENGYSPSVRELCEILGKNSTATIQFGLKILKRKGYIENRLRRSRTIKVLKWD